MASLFKVHYSTLHHTELFVIRFDFLIQFLLLCERIRIRRRSRRIEIEDSLEIKKSLSMRWLLQILFMLVTCRFTLRKNKFMNYFHELVKLRRLSWVWIRTLKLLAVFASFCKLQFSNSFLVFSMHLFILVLDINL
jgi:hypothetical protein